MLFEKMPLQIFVHINLDDRAGHREGFMLLHSSSSQPPEIHLRLFTLLSTRKIGSRSPDGGSRFLHLWEMLRNCNALPSLFSYFDNSIQDFRLSFSTLLYMEAECCCSLLCMHSVLSAAVTRIFLSHVFHLILQRVMFFWGEPVLSFCRTKWLTTVWPLVV